MIFDATNTVILVGEDVDHLVLMIALTPSDRNLIFLKPGRGRMLARQYSSSDLQTSLGSLKDYILFLHAASDCDTVSSCFGQGKHKLIRLLQNREELRNHAAVFDEKSATQEIVSEAGEKLLISLYGILNWKKI